MDPIGNREKAALVEEARQTFGEEAAKQLDELLAREPEAGEA